MNLKQAGGKVPIPSGNRLSPILLIDFPTETVFFRLFRGRVTTANQERYWDILCRRAQGATLEDAGRPYGLTRERVRQIEARFIRMMANYHWKTALV